MTLQTSSRTSGRRRNASQALLDAAETAPKDKETAAMRGSIHVPPRPPPAAQQSTPRQTHSQFSQTIDVRRSTRPPPIIPRKRQSSSSASSKKGETKRIFGRPRTIIEADEDLC